ncbi:MAG TPA: S1C family serine protease [Acidimicrobiales bacterium]
MSMLDELGQAVEEVAASAGRSVVRVGRDWRGCGVVVEPGVIVTNAHNLRGPEVTVTLADGRQIAASVAGADVEGDLAVLSADTGDVTPVAWAPAPPTVGSAVVGVGGGTSSAPRATLGFVSAVDQAFRGPRGRRVAGAIEHTAPLARGSSGGPVLDAHGRLVGINTHRLGDGFYMAVPADDSLRSRIDALAAGDAPRHLRLGIGIAPAAVARRLRRAVGLPPRDGLLVRKVDDASPAGRAGIREGDMIATAGGAELRTADDLHEALDRLAPGAPLLLGVVRGADDLEIAVSFDAAASEEEGQV